MNDKIAEWLNNQNFALFYQPQVNVDGKIVGAEALIRSITTSGIVLPEQFIRVAETSGSIIDIGEWVFKKSSFHLQEWIDQKIIPDEFQLSINVSSIQIDEPDFCDKFCKKFENINPKNIAIEITESTLGEKYNIAKLHQISNHGIEISIDDFGQGYSSLARLKFLPIDTIKIDKMFINDIVTSDSDYLLVKAIYELSLGLKLNSIVEGIESIEQFKILKEIGFEKFQGFCFSEPVPVDIFTEMLRKQSLNCCEGIKS